MGDCVFGLRVGSYSATVCAYRDGRMEVLANEFGHRSTPSIVAYHGGEKLVGQAAKQSIHKYASCTATHMVFLLGQHSMESVSEAVEDIPCTVGLKDGSVVYQLSLGGKECAVPVEDPLTEVLKKLKETADSFDRGSQMMSVVAAPANFTEEQQQLLRGCATSVGFQVLRCISEPAAACLAYGIGQHDVSYSGHALVFNLGGSTLSLTILHVAGGMYRTLISHTLPSLGGQLFNSPLVDVMCEEFQRQWKEDLRGQRRALEKLRAAAELAKHTLSMDQTASVHIDSLHDGIDFQYSLTRGRFEGVCGPLFRKMLEPISSLLTEAGVDRNSLDHVVLAGGSCKIPRLQQLLQEAFPCSTLHRSLPPDEVVTRGCALQAGLMTAMAGRRMEEGGRQSQVVSCTREDLWLTSAECEAVQLLPKHTPIPCQRSTKLTVKPNAQDTVCVELREGSLPANRVIANLRVPVTTTLVEVTIEVSLNWKRDNTVSLSARKLSDDSVWTCSVTLECHTTR